MIIGRKFKSDFKPRFKGLLLRVTIRENEGKRDLPTVYPIRDCRKDGEMCRGQRREGVNEQETGGGER